MVGEDKVVEQVGEEEVVEEEEVNTVQEVVTEEAAQEGTAEAKQEAAKEAAAALLLLAPWLAICTAVDILRACQPVNSSSHLSPCASPLPPHHPFALPPPSLHPTKGAPTPHRSPSPTVPSVYPPLLVLHPGW